MFRSNGKTLTKVSCCYDPFLRLALRTCRQASWLGAPSPCAVHAGHARIPDFVRALEVLRAGFSLRAIDGAGRV